LEIVDAVNISPAPQTNYMKFSTPDISIPAASSTGTTAQSETTCASIIHSMTKTKKRINKTATKARQSPTQDEYDNAFTQHADEDERPASQHEEGVIEPPRHTQSTPRCFLSKKIGRNIVIVSSQNVQGLKDGAKLETMIHIIEERKVYTYCVQETSLEGDFEQELKNGM
jgi:hypothetical protein